MHMQSLQGTHQNTCMHAAVNSMCTEHQVAGQVLPSSTHPILGQCDLDEFLVKHGLGHEVGSLIAHQRGLQTKSRG